ncbi:MAG: hypothetical protein Fur0037_19150 [Planctomycetota bacterium]
MRILLVSIPLAFLCLPEALSAQGALTRGPAVADVTTSGATIQWSTAAPSGGAIEWGTTSALGRTAPATATATQHEVRVFGLRPFTRYYYRVLDGSTPVGPIHSFRTAAPADHPYARIAVFGDAGTGSAGQLAVARLTGELAPDLVLMPGDINYPSGAASTIDRAYFAPYAGLLPEIPFYLAPGNHDYYAACGQAYYSSFCLPTSPQGGEQWYSFDFGDVHVVSINTEIVPTVNGTCGNAALAAAQLAWLDADLAASRATWKIAMLHRPPRSYSTHGSNAAVQAAFEPVLEARGVDLVLSGHDHCYQRFPRMVGGIADPRGPRHLVVGTGGASPYPISPGPLLEFGASTVGLVLLDVTGNQLRIRFFDAGTNYGQVLDDVTMQKGSYTPSLAASGTAIPLGGSSTLSVLAESAQPWVLVADDESGSLPLPPHGLWLLGSTPALLGAGAIGTGPNSVVLSVPQSPALVGLMVSCQALAGSTDPALRGMRITNAIELAVR